MASFGLGDLYAPAKLTALFNFAHAAYRFINVLGSNVYQAQR
jgi:hypothetical protein